MQLPPTIAFRRMRGTEALEADIRRRLAQLERYCPDLMAARVLVEEAERHHQSGNRVHVRLDLTAPGQEIAISHEASLRPDARTRPAGRTRKQDEPDRTHRDAAFAVREAFAAARRRLQDYVRRRRGQVKTHAAAPRALRRRAQARRS